MGGFFSPPSAPVLPPPPPPIDPGEEERRRRVEAIERRRRGRAGTVATSERGVLDESVSSPSRAQKSPAPLKDKLGD